MKKGIHPKLYETKIVCASGAEYPVVSTKKELKTDVSSANHPFYTGQRKIVDTTGRVERFRRRYGLSADQESVPAGKKQSDQEEG